MIEQQLGSREQMVSQALENTRDSNFFSELTQAAAKDTRRVRKFIKGMEGELIDSVQQLSPQEYASFTTELADRLKKKQEQTRTTNLLLGRLLKNGAIPQEAVNPDGTFAIEKVQSEPYFQDNPHLIETLELRTRQLAEKSKIRQRVANSVDMPQPYKGKHQSGETKTIAESYCPRHNKNIQDQIEIHDEAEHGHIHHLHENSSMPVISRRWQAATIAGNALIGVAELITGGSSTLAVTADGIHNAGDAGTYYLQTENVLNPQLSREKSAKKRKIAHTVIAGLSLAAAAKAGYDLQLGEETVADPLTIYTASASLALNSLLVATLYRGINRRRHEGRLSVHETDLTKHLWAIDVPSASIAVGGVVAQKYGIDDVEQIGAVASGLIGAYAFRPTIGNLDHSNCAKHVNHNHDHTHEHHIIDNEAEVILTHPIKSKRSAQAAASLALVAAIGAGATASTSEALLTPVTPLDSGKQTTIVQMPHGETSPVPSKPTIVFERVQANDTQWSKAKSAVTDAGYEARPSLVNIIADLTAIQNQETNPNPDAIEVNQNVSVPSKEAIEVVATGIANPTQDLELSQGIQALNATKSMAKQEKIDKEGSTISKIWKKIKEKVSSK